MPARLGTCDAHPDCYDIDALPNVAADALRVIGFDPFLRFTDRVQALAEGR